MNPLRLPFDQYQRYRVVADIVERLRPLVGEKRKLRILDVGGRTANLRAFLPKDDVMLVDMEASDAEGLVLGDGSRLPFASESFDAVCAFDTLEHVPRDRREAFVDECWRVTKSWVLLAGPYDSVRVRKGERLLHRFLSDKLKVEHRYLKEHLDFGLPNRKDLESWFRQQGGEVASLGHGNLDRWFALMCLELYIDDDAALRPLASALFEFYNKSLYASDHADPVYRHVVIGAFNGAPLPDLEGLLEPPVAPAGTLAPFTELLQQLTVFDRERKDWRLERAAFDKSVRELAGDLSGHRAVLSAQVRELSKRAQVSEVLQADLTGHKATLNVERESRVAAEHARDACLAELAQLCEVQAETEVSRGALQQDLDGHKQTLKVLQRERDSLAETASTLEADLKGHKETQATISQERDGLLEAVRSLESDLSGHRDSLELAQEELSTGRQGSADLAADLAGHKASLDTIRQERDSLLDAVTCLESDLLGHRGSLQSAQTELTAERQGGRDLAADLAGHNASLAELNRERERLLETVASLGDDLLGHKGSLKTLAGDLDAERGMAAALRQELAGREMAALAAEQNAKTSEQRAASLESDLADRKQRLLASQVQLKDSLGAILVLEAKVAEAGAAQLELKQVRRDHASASMALVAEQDLARQLRAQVGSQEAQLIKLKGEVTQLSKQLQEAKLALDGGLDRERQLGAELGAEQGKLGAMERELEAEKHRLKVEVARAEGAEVNLAHSMAARKELERDVSKLEAELIHGLEQHRSLLQSCEAQMMELRAAAERLEEPR